MGFGLLASVTYLAVESSPRSKIAYNIFVKIARLCSEATQVFVQKVPNLKKEKCKFWTTRILSLCFSGAGFLLVALGS